MGTFRTLAPGKRWHLVGYMGVAAAFMILAFYSSVAGWTLEYIYQSLINGFEGKSSGELKVMFESFHSSSFRPVLWFFVFIGLTALIIFSGVKNGIERSTKILMPLLFLILVILIVRSVTLPGAFEGIRFLFKPDFDKINATTVLTALGQAFFSLSVGMGTLITYASYMPKNNNLGSTAMAVAFTDLFVAILAGIAIFPAVFAFGITPEAGTGLVFIALPNIFQQMAGGYFFSLIFFVLLAVAAITSTISLLEVIVAFFTEELKLKRRAATWIATAIVSVFGVMAALSGGVMSEVKLFGLTVFNLLEFTSANILLPLGGFCIVMFVAWFFGRDRLKFELSNAGKLKVGYLPFFLFVIRFLAPLCIAFIFLQSIGLIKV